MATPTNSTIGLIIDSTADEQSVIECLKILRKNEQIEVTQLLVLSPRQGVPKRDFTKLGELYPNTSIQQVAARTNFSELLKTIQTDFIGYIPSGATPSGQLPDIASIRFNVLAPWLAEPDLPNETAKEIPVDAVAWIASNDIVQSISPQLNDPNNWTVLEVALALEKNSIPFRWRTMQTSQSEFPLLSGSKVRLTLKAILALVPHYQCETWLRRCLSSLITQSRSLEGIVVIDDGSGNPPISIVQEFPTVTLLSATDRVGPYRLIQQVIDDTNYDAYLFQDADDWSTSDRLEKLLLLAEAIS